MNNALGVTRMITRHASTATKPSQRIAGSGSALIALLLAFAGAAHAENVLEEITYSPGPGGQVDVRMKLSEPPVDPKLFTTDSPARIAVDFDNTRNGLTERRINVGTGATSAISAVEAGGRTRVVVELFRTSRYTSRVEGDTLVVSIGNGSGTDRGNGSGTGVVSGGGVSPGIGSPDGTGSGAGGPRRRRPRWRSRADGGGVRRYGRDPPRRPSRSRHVGPGPAHRRLPHRNV